MAATAWPASKHWASIERGVAPTNASVTPVSARRSKRSVPWAQTASPASKSSDQSPGVVCESMHTCTARWRKPGYGHSPETLDIGRMALDPAKASRESARASYRRATDPVRDMPGRAFGAADRLAGGGGRLTCAGLAQKGARFAQALDGIGDGLALLGGGRRDGAHG
ncbi:hypothetical protein Swit_5252 (plasmid) [Rhizorhabdus wittichii RW1]|uniref:Uncharacterized protein n=1 Tax=Rhizorhabdus wittichii (strain DSM 6014 / CCUG 31198 / JCM 15750 / NBRC 105917 / EY 4224 / RW1) TaxID=392499 RepID=A0A9J9LGQ5_RHIWR|nr:hypothetical protein Swit_5252 [Rhizorhabdus wittichii RW1]